MRCCLAIRLHNRSIHHHVHHAVLPVVVVQQQNGLLPIVLQRLFGRGRQLRLILHRNTRRPMVVVLFLDLHLAAKLDRAYAVRGGPIIIQLMRERRPDKVQPQPVQRGVEIRRIQGLHGTRICVIPHLHLQRALVLDTRAIGHRGPCRIHLGLTRSRRSAGRSHRRHHHSPSYQSSSHPHQQPHLEFYLDAA